MLENKFKYQKYCLVFVLACFLLAACAAPQTVTQKLPNSDSQITVKSSYSDVNNKVTLTFFVDHGSCSPLQQKAVSANSITTATCTVNNKSWIITINVDNNLDVKIVSIK